MVCLVELPELCRYQHTFLFPELSVVFRWAGECYYLHNYSSWWGVSSLHQRMRNWGTEEYLIFPLSCRIQWQKKLENPAVLTVQSLNQKFFPWNRNVSGWMIDVAWVIRETFLPGLRESDLLEKVSRRAPRKTESKAETKDGVIKGSFCPDWLMGWPCWFHLCHSVAGMSHFTQSEH